MILKITLRTRRQKISSWLVVWQCSNMHQFVTFVIMWVCLGNYGNHEFHSTDSENHALLWKQCMYTQGLNNPVLIQVVFKFKFQNLIQVFKFNILTQFIFKCYSSILMAKVKGNLKVIPTVWLWILSSWTIYWNFLSLSFLTCILRIEIVPTW